MELLSLPRYQDLVEGAEILSSEYVEGRVSPKVLRLKDQSIIKLFRLKRVLSSARLVPYAVRFQRHVVMLQAADVPTVDVHAVYKITTIDRTAVHYRPLPGPTLREHCTRHPIDRPLARVLGQFFEHLHRNGIYFRSIHFGNMVLTTHHRFGLIDVVDMRFRNGPLGMGLRKRNLRHLFRYDDDRDCLLPVRHDFIDAYCDSARLPPRRERQLRREYETYFQTHTSRNDVSG